MHALYKYINFHEMTPQDPCRPTDWTDGRISTDTYPYLSISISLYISIHLYLSISMSLYLYVSLSLSLYLSLYSEP